MESDLYVGYYSCVKEDVVDEEVGDKGELDGVVGKWGGFWEEEGVKVKVEWEVEKWED